MSAALVACTCDPSWPAMAVCLDCERRRLHDRLVTRGVVRPIVGDTRGACRHAGPGHVHRGIVVCGVCRSEDWRQLRGAMA